MISQASFIPETIPDETVYSICSLYHQMSGSPSWLATNTYLFGNSHNRSIALIPPRMGHFSSRFAHLFRNTEDAIDLHTIYPYFRAVIGNRDLKRLAREATSPNESRNKLNNHQLKLVGLNCGLKVRIRVA